MSTIIYPFFALALLFLPGGVWDNICWCFVPLMLLPHMKSKRMSKLKNIPPPVLSM